MAGWDSAQYLKFAAERTRPARELLAGIPPVEVRRALDVGCGPGNSTAVLRARYGEAQLTGVDSSEEMLRTARAALPDCDFLRCDVGRELSKLPGEFDLVFSNACIQWVPDHRSLLPGLVGLLRTGGVLAVQVPVNWEEPVHRIIGEVAGSARWREKFQNPRIFYTLTEGEYFDLLSDCAREVDLWRTTYFHRLRSHGELLEWYRGTGLRPYLAALSPEEGAAFEREIYAELVRAYPRQRNGEILFRFPRLFFTAVR